MTVPVHGLPSLMREGLKVAVVPPQLKGSRWHTVEEATDDGRAGQLVSFADVTTIDGAQGLVGRYVLASREDLPDDFELRNVELLVGRQVTDEGLGLSGTIAEVMVGPANDVWVIDVAGEGELRFRHRPSGGGGPREGGHPGQRGGILPGRCRQVRFETLSVFPEVFAPYLDASIMGRAQRAGILDFAAHDLRDWTHDRHRTVDDAPFGGGQGMLMKPAPIFEAVEALSAEGPRPHVVFFSPCGRRYDQSCAEALSHEERVLLVCGRYEGMDERAYELADDVFSLGDYVLTGGELAAMVVIDSVVRLLPGALGDAMSAKDESFSDGLLEYAQYTRPASYRGMDVPEVLLGGDHAKVDAWRRRSAVERTARWRPDLIEGADLTPDELALARAVMGGEGDHVL